MNPARQNVESQNAQAWDRLAREQAALARPARDEDFAHPLRTVDPLGWLEGSIAGKKVLCLAAGGGRQSALYAAAGADVAVLDISREMLLLDVQVAAERKLTVRTVEGSMLDLSMFEPGEFDIVIHPVSSCYVADIREVYRQVARIVRPGGLYISQHKSPTSLQTELKPSGEGYALVEPYYRTGPLPPAEKSRLREPGAQEFLHRWEDLLGGMCQAGFVIEDFIEPHHADPQADRGTFAHRACYVAPYMRIKARKRAREGDGKRLWMPV